MHLKYNWGARQILGKICKRWINITEDVYRGAEHLLLFKGGGNLISLCRPRFSKMTSDSQWPVWDVIKETGFYRVDAQNLMENLSCVWFSIKKLRHHYCLLKILALNCHSPDLYDLKHSPSPQIPIWDKSRNQRPFPSLHLCPLRQTGFATYPDNQWLWDLSDQGETAFQKEGTRLQSII